MEFCLVKKKKFYKFLYHFGTMFLLLSFLFPMNVKAYESWVQGSASFEGLYGGGYTDDEMGSGDSNVGTGSGQVSEEEDPTKDDILSKMFGNFFGSLAVKIQNVLEGEGALSFSIDGIILGRLRGTPVTYTAFELAEGNVYGYMGAVVYRILRDISFSLIFLSFIILLFKASTKSDAKSHFLVKEALMTSILMFMMLYLMPLIVDTAIFFKDNILNSLLVGLTRLNGVHYSTGIIGTYSEQFQRDPGLFTAILYLAVGICSIFFLGSYVKLAATQTVFFGCFPFIAVLSIFDRKLLNNWCSQFFSNLFVPVIDLVLFLMPNMLLNALHHDHPFISMLLVILLISGIMPLRNAVLQLFGNVTGVQLGRGMGGLAMMGMMALRTMRGGGRRSGSLEGASGADHNSDVENARRNSELAQNLEEGGATFASHQRQLQDIDSMYGRSETGGSVSSSSEGSGMSQDSYGSTGGESAYASSMEQQNDTSSYGTGEAAAVGLNQEQDRQGYRGGEASPTNVTMDDNSSVKENSFENIRYGNLMAMDNANSRMNSLRHEKEAIREEINGNTQEIKEHSSRRDGYLQQADVLQQKLDAANEGNGNTIEDEHGNNISITEGKDRMENYRIQAEAEQKRVSELQSTNNEKQEMLRRNEEQQNMVSDELKARQNAEKGMAASLEASGGNGRSYQDAASFERQQQIDQIKKKYINYKNFDSKDFQGVLSAKEKAAYYRERAKHNSMPARMVKGAGRTAGTIAGGVVVGGVAAGMTMAAGPAGMAAAAVLAGGAGARAGGMSGEALGRTAVNAGIRGMNFVQDNHVSGGAREIHASPSRRELSRVDSGNIPEFNDNARRGNERR